MQNIKDMKEVEPGIFIPTEKFYVHDTSEWRHENKGFSCMLDKETRQCLTVFRNDVNGIAYSDRNHKVPTFCVGGIDDVDYPFHPKYYPVED